jgi:Ca-activated chloride channel family protein
MFAEDITIGRERSNRLEAVKKLTGDFIAGRPSDRIGIVAFAGRPYMVSPLTLDHDWLQKNLDRIRIGLVEDGTAICLFGQSSKGSYRIKVADYRSFDRWRQ